MLLDYYFILILSGLAVIIPLSAILLGYFLGPQTSGSSQDRNV